MIVLIILTIALGVACDILDLVRMQKVEDRIKKLEETQELIIGDLDALPDTDDIEEVKQKG